MKQRGENLILFLAISIVVINIVGLGIPLWHAKSHERRINNSTEEELRSTCIISVKIREGLWQRYCYEVKGAECVPDLEEWCDNLDGQDFTHFVKGLEMAGDLFVSMAAIVIIRSKCRKKVFKMEMVGAEIGLGGLLMLVGALVFATADGGEIGFMAEDLHVGWGLCSGAGALALLVCAFAWCLNQCAIQRDYTRYFPINDIAHSFSDEEMIEI